MTRAKVMYKMQFSSGDDNWTFGGDDRLMITTSNEWFDLVEACKQLRLARERARGHEVKYRLVEVTKGEITYVMNA